MFSQTQNLRSKTKFTGSPMQPNFIFPERQPMFPVSTSWKTGSPSVWLKKRLKNVDVLWCFYYNIVGWFAFTTLLHHDLFTVVWFCTMINLCKPLCFTNPWPLRTYDDQLGCQAPVWMPMRMAKAGKPNFWNSSFNGPKAWIAVNELVSFQWGICFLP